MCCFIPRCTQSVPRYDPRGFKMKFTVRNIEVLKPKHTRYEAYDDNDRGFGIRVSPYGYKCWITRYKTNKRQRKYTHGEYRIDGKSPYLNLASAREEHHKVRAKIRKGIDPQAEKQISKTLSQNAPTVKELAEDFIALYAKPNKKSWKDDENRLEKHVLPKYGKLKAKDINRKHINLMLDDLLASGLGVGANRVFAVVRKMFNWAVSRGILNASPCAQVSAPFKENKRERVLSLDELHNFLSLLPNSNMGRQYQIVLLLMLITAQRKCEILNMQKDEVDLKNGWWVIPGNKTKNGLQHRVPLSNMAIELIEEAITLSGNSKYLFPSPIDEKKSIHEATICHKLAEIRDEMDIHDFIPHDLRRTAASYMASIGVPQLVVSKILNHVDSSVTAVYVRHGYDEEKRDALNKWERWIIELTKEQQSKVIYLSK